MQYRKIETPDGQCSVRYALRRGRYLVMFTSFDAMRHIDFAEGMAAASPVGMELESAYTYDDGTGYYVFRVDLAVAANARLRALICEFVDNAFMEYF